VRYIRDIDDPRKEVFKALACGRRISILEILKDGEKCVCDLIPLLNIDQSAVSRHLSILKQAGFLVSWKKGVNVYYKLADPIVLKLLDIASEIVKKRDERDLRRLR